MRALSLHGHFYQPPREHPWLGVVEPEASAAPHRDWNTRITTECYAPNAAARVLDGAGRLAALVNNYEWTSFNFGPTLLAWLAPHAPDVLAALRRADAASQARTGHGSAWAQAYGHPILPLSTARDVRTQVFWGRADFEHRFGRAPDGMWLPEMAVDRAALLALADAGVTLTILAPHQARRVRPLGGPDTAWTAVTPDTLDTRRVYRCLVGAGRAVDVVFRDAGISHDVAFGPLLHDGAGLVARLRAALAEGPKDGLLTVAVDGETYGHHHRFGEMALAFALRALAGDPEVALLPPAAYRDVAPPTHEVDIVERTSWSCPHGVERWRADCGCHVGGPPTWNQAWRAPLRAAIDWLRDELVSVYEARAGDVLRDPWGARDRYVACVLEPARTDAFIAEEARTSPSPDARRAARHALELARHALLMQTSCGWFFDDLTGIEPVQVLRYAARAIELAAGFGSRLESDFCARLEPARSNSPGGPNGAELYRRAARRKAGTPARIAASTAMLALLGQDASVPGHTVALPAGDGGRIAGDAEVRDHATDETVRVRLVAEARDGGFVCRAGDDTFTLADLFGVQREALLAALGRDAASAVEEAGRAALAGVRPLLDIVLDGDVPLPPSLAPLLGWEGAGAIVAGIERGVPAANLTAEAALLRRRGARYPVEWLASHIAEAVEAAAAALPERAEELVALLDLARAVDVPLDLERAQRTVFEWLRGAPDAPAALVATLRDRLALAPEAP